MPQKRNLTAMPDDGRIPFACKALDFDPYLEVWNPLLLQKNMFCMVRVLLAMLTFGTLVK
ncbi:MAG TPA: hypothetical protein VFC67_11420 [Prolixibacteraceae bacterium]|nr:hypothetical protein [Prolixibacteraceae bacterium]